MTADLWELGPPASAAAEFRPGNLEAKFVAPPFSVLDTRQGYWQERRRAWLSLGIKSELGRGADLLALSPAEGARARWTEALPSSTSKGDTMANQMASTLRTTKARQAMERQNAPGYRAQAALRSGEGRELEAGKGNHRTDYGAYTTNEEEGALGGTSIFDPVLCELMYRWFAPEGGQVLDPFAGGSVRGIVAAKLGHPYTGIDLSGAQLEANRGQAAAILAPGEPVPTWLQGDSVHLEELLPAGELYDMVMTCPPYFDLEVYSDDPADLSNAGEYSAFLEGYGQVLHRAAARLRQERFMVLVVSEIRDPAGYCRGFVPDTIRAAQAAGLHLYNEAVLVNAAGSLPLRVTKYMEASRKLGRAHQNVLCFVKGKPPRGWSYDRAAPPSPQLSLALEPEAADETDASQPPPMPAAVDEAAPVLARTEEAPTAPGPSEALNAPEDPIGWSATAAAASGPTTPLPCSRRYCTLDAGHANGCVLEAPAELEEGSPEWVADVEGMPADPAGLAYDRLEDGRWVDTATGQLFEADEEGGVGAPADLQPLAVGEADALAAAGATVFPLIDPAVAAAVAGEPTLAELLPVDWGQAPPDRSGGAPCWSCGAPPSGSYRDGSPRYDCTHPATKEVPQ